MIEVIELEVGSGLDPMTLTFPIHALLYSWPLETSHSHLHIVTPGAAAVAPGRALHEYKELDNCGTSI